MNVRDNFDHRIARGGLMAILMLAMSAGVAWAQTCEIPLISQQVAVPPNVMILLDNSGSMNHVMWHEAYEDTITYPGPFERNKTYFVSSDGMRGPNSFDSDQPSSPKAMFVSGLHGRYGRYYGNYLNWIFFTATDQQRSEIPVVTRQQVANTAVKYVMSAAAGLRYGITRFNTSDGGTVVADCGSSMSTLQNIVDNVVANTWTPTGETMVDILNYFKDPSGPIEYECQKNFLVVVTDGEPTKDLDVPSWIGDQDGDGNEPGTCASMGYTYMSNSNDCSDYMDDVAYYLAHNDLRSDLSGQQIVNTYTIGFGLDTSILWETAENGDGLYRVAWDLESLVVELGTVIGDIVNRISSGAAVAVVSTETGTDSHLYRGKFMPGVWRGFLESFSLPYSPGQNPEWEAGRLLRDRSAPSREIFTNLNNTRVDIADVNADVLQYFLAPNGPGSGTDPSWGDNGDDIYNAADETLGPSFDPIYVGDLIEWVRGEDTPGYRVRDGWKLGDLVYSTPVVVGPPAFFFPDPAYQAYISAFENRRHVVYVGSNDGMLHAFDASTGEEMWGYVPRAVLGTLEELADPNYCHRSYVDLSPAAYDVQIGGAWRTVVLGGERTGGASYFALDVTYPESPQVLWETTIPTLFSSYTDPVVVRTGRGDFLWAGSGPNPGGTAYSGVIDVDTGYVHWNLLLSSSPNTNAATAPVAYDSDYDGKANIVYQADLDGNLWRYDVSDDGIWLYSKMFDGNLPISARPALAVGEDGYVRVYFGTGKFVEGADMSTTDQQYFYCIRDNGTFTTFTQADLVDQTSTVTELTPDDDGWYFALENGSGERVTEPAVSIEGVVYFTSFAPSDQPCSAGGRSWLYAVSYTDGNSIDHDGDGSTDDETRSETLGDGVASRPVVNLAGEQLIVQTSDARLNIQNLVLPPQRIRVRAWREQFDVDPSLVTQATSGQE